MFAWQIIDPVCLDRAKHLLCGIELLCFAEMDMVSRVYDEGWAIWQSVDTLNGLLKRADYIRIGRRVRPDMGVGDLYKTEASSLLWLATPRSRSRGWSSCVWCVLIE
jgi:hypothetical protein